MQPLPNAKRRAAWIAFAAASATLVVVAFPLVAFRAQPADGNAAIALLRELEQTQIAFRQARRHDVDGDGRGESGCLAELAEFARSTPRRAGALDGRGAARTGVDFAELHGGSGRSGGYRFRVVLPVRGGGWCASRNAEVDTDRSERDAITLAWPEDGTDDDRVFVLDPRGRLWVWKDQRRSFRGLVTEPPLELGHELLPLGPSEMARDADARVWIRVH